MSWVCRSRSAAGAGGAPRIGTSPPREISSRGPRGCGSRRQARLIEVDQDELARDQAAEASRAAIRTSQQLERDAEAEERRKLERAVDERFEREAPPGVAG